MTLFIGGAILDGEHDALRDHAVLVEGERIVDVGPTARFSGYAGPRFDLAGATLLPGLIDCHVHLCFGAEPDVIALLGQLRPADFAVRALANAQATLRGGVTTVRDLGGSEYAEIAVRNSIRSGRHVGPTILCAGKMICITGGHGWFVGIEADGADGCIHAVRTNIKAGADWIKFMATGGVMTAGIDPLAAHQTEEETIALVREANRLGRRTACHATGAAGIMQAVLAGATSIEHGFQMDDAIIEAMLKRKTVLVPTLSAIASADGDACMHLPNYVVERVAAYRDMQRDSALKFYRAGGRIAMGTDAGTPFNRAWRERKRARANGGARDHPARCDPCFHQQRRGTARTQRPGPHCRRDACRSANRRGRSACRHFDDRKLVPASRGLQGRAPGPAMKSVCAFLLLGMVAAAWPGDAPKLTWADCVTPALQSGKFACGVLEVPESWGSAATESVTLPFAIRRAKSPHPDSVAFLIGGPGGTNIGYVAAHRAELRHHRPRHRLSRATRRGILAAFADLLRRIEPREADRPGGDKAVVRTPCVRRTWTSMPIGTTAAARDLEALRKLLGVKQWDLFGASYGTAACARR